MNRHESAVRSRSSLRRAQRLRFRPDLRCVEPAGLQSSLNAVTAKLSTDEQHKLAVALMTLAIGDLPQSNAFELANPGSTAKLVTLDGVSNPLVLLDRMRPAINGRSASAVIGRVATDLDSRILRTEAGAAASTRRWPISRSKVRVLLGQAQQSADHRVLGLQRRQESHLAHLCGRDRDPTRPCRKVGELDPGAEVPVKLMLRAFSAETAKQLQSLYDTDFRLKVTNAAYEMDKSSFRSTLTFWKRCARSETFCAAADSAVLRCTVHPTCQIAERALRVAHCAAHRRGEPRSGRSW